MGKYISFGEYDKQYRYIWIYLGTRFLSTFIFSNQLIFPIYNSTDALYLPDHPFITRQTDYLAYIIISIIIKIIKKFFNKKETDKDLPEGKLIYNEKDIENEYGVQQNDIFLFVNIFFLVIIDIVNAINPKLKNSLFDYWMFEMLYYELYHSWLFKTKLYRHHIYSLIGILSSCFIVKTISIIIKMTEDEKYADEFYFERKWFIPISMVIYFLFRIFKAYTYGNLKYYFDKRVYKISSFILFYGIFGLLATLIGAITSTYVSCGDETLPELSKKLCPYSLNNQTIFYFDNYSIYYGKLSKYFFAARIVFLILQKILNYASTYYTYEIFKKLSPIYFICTNRLNVLTLNILWFFSDLINKGTLGDISIKQDICDFIIYDCYIIGSIIYLEFIELNCCGLNFYTKRNIKRRANNDSLGSIYSIADDSVNSESTSKEDDE